jgi:hypothetical protein
MFRLKGWQWQGMSINRPQVVGYYTRDIVYARLAHGIVEELERRNPKDDKGERRGRHHQLLTDDIGDPALAQHLYAVILDACCLYMEEILQFDSECLSEKR